MFFLLAYETTTGKHTHSDTLVRDEHNTPTEGLAWCVSFSRVFWFLLCDGHKMEKGATTSENDGFPRSLAPTPPPFPLHTLHNILHSHIQHHHPPQTQHTTVLCCGSCLLLAVGACLLLALAQALRRSILNLSQTTHTHITHRFKPFQLSSDPTKKIRW